RRLFCHGQFNGANRDQSQDTLRAASDPGGLPVFASTSAARASQRGSMLVLRRRAGESVLIGDDVEVQILAVTPQGAQVGIRAPSETLVLRKELKVTQEQNEAAARSPARIDLQRAMEKLRG